MVILNYQISQLQPIPVHINFTAASNIYSCLGRISVPTENPCVSTSLDQAPIDVLPVLTSTTAGPPLPVLATSRKPHCKLTTL